MFCMLTTRRLMELSQPGNWFPTINLKDAYFYFVVVLKHRKFLCFFTDVSLIEKVGIYLRRAIGGVQPSGENCAWSSKAVLVRKDNRTTVTFISR